MRLDEIQDKIPAELFLALKKGGITEHRPAQTKAIDAGLLERESLLICTPTASGKTLIAELAAMTSIFTNRGRAIYIVPLVALASEKVKHFKQRYGSLCKVALSVGDFDSADPHLANYDFIVCTAEKLDSLLRHSTPWLGQVSTIIVDEVHLLNDVSRGPTLEILLTILRRVLPNVQIVALSATIGNPQALAEWLGAGLILDNWRPTVLHKGVFFDDKISFEK